MNTPRQHALAIMPTGRRGFTLIEVLLAISILGIGLVLAAALFPTAMMHNRASASNTMGTIVCENALTVVRNRITDSAYGAAFATATDPKALNTHLLDPTDPNSIAPNGQRLLGRYDLIYPLPQLVQPDLAQPPRLPTATEIKDKPEAYPDWMDSNGVKPRSRYGAAVLIRKTGDLNDYQILIAGYHLLDPRYTCKWVLTGATIDTNNVLNGGGDNIQVGTPVAVEIGPKGGAANRIEYVNATSPGNSARLNRVIQLNAIPAEDIKGIYAATQFDSNGNNLTGTFSPVMHVMSVRTALRQ